MPSASEIVLQYVMPALGMVTANLMFSAPLKDAPAGREPGHAGQFEPNAVAYNTSLMHPTTCQMLQAFMTGNCLGWVTYSYLIQNQFVFWANAPGLIISVWLNLCGAKLQYSDRISASMRSSFVNLLDRNRRSFALAPGERRVLGGDLNKEEEEDTGGIQNGLSSGVQTFANLRKTALEITIQKTEAPAPHEKGGGVRRHILGGGHIAVQLPQISIDMWQMVIGIVVNVNLLFFYGAPLSTIVTVFEDERQQLDPSMDNAHEHGQRNFLDCFWIRRDGLVYIGAERNWSDTWIRANVSAAGDACKRICGSGC
ncbi:hypothetical protein ACHAXT_012404 [Thalassiosira profunda]